MDKALFGWTKGLVGNNEEMRRKSCFFSGSYICGLMENFPQFTLLKKCNTPKIYAALLHTLISQPIVSESHSSDVGAREAQAE